MESQFGDKIRTLRELQNLYLRQVAPLLEMDTAQLSKIEKGLRQLKKEQLPILAKILNADKVELETLWLADQLMQLVKDEPSDSRPKSQRFCIFIFYQRTFFKNNFSQPHKWHIWFCPTHKPTLRKTKRAIFCQLTDGTNNKFNKLVVDEKTILFNSFTFDSFSWVQPVIFGLGDKTGQLQTRTRD